MPHKIKQNFLGKTYTGRVQSQSGYRFYIPIGLESSDSEIDIYPDLASGQIGVYNICPDGEKLAGLRYSSSIGFWTRPVIRPLSWIRKTAK